MQHHAYKAGTATTPTLIIAAVLSAILLSAPAARAALTDDSLIEGAKLCTRYLPRHERQYGIPVHLLAAIASTESGRFHKALGLNLPWPWTVNVEGQGYFFDTKEEAVAAVRRFQERGFQSIDVGCMQVNLYHHPYAFANLDQAFDPAYNVAYAAQFLKHNFEDEGSWRKATADYHSHTAYYGDQYARLVFGAWERIINKVADAQAGRPILNVASQQPHAFHYHDRSGVLAADDTMRRPRGIYHAPHMHEMSVSSDTTREKGVLVIRPEHDVQPVQQASIDEREQFVVRSSEEKQNAGASPRKSASVVVVSADTTSRDAHIVRVQDGREVSSKGQFEPESRVIHVGDYSAASATGADPKPSRNTFVFEN